MAEKYPLARRNAQGDAEITAAGNASLLRMYSGTVPATADTALTSQVLLSTLTCGSPFATTTSGGVISPTTPTGGTIVANGTASFYRHATTGATLLRQGEIGASGSGKEMIVSTTNFVIGVTPLVISWTITMGNP